MHSQSIHESPGGRQGREDGLQMLDLREARCLGCDVVLQRTNELRLLRTARHQERELWMPIWIQKEKTEMNRTDKIDLAAIATLLLLLSLGVYCMVRMFRDSDAAHRKAKVIPLGSVFNSHQ